MTRGSGYETLSNQGMGQDGHDPPKLGHVSALRGRPKLSVILGGALKPTKGPEESVILRSSLSTEGRARLLRTLRMLGAERAFLFVWDDQEFTLSEACACDESGAEPRDRNVMWSLLDRITSQRAPLVMAGTDDQPSDAMMSGVTPPLRMAIAVPLINGQDLKGVACFDKRIHKGQFVDADAGAALAIMDALALNAEHLKSLATEEKSNLCAVPAKQITQALIGAMSPALGSAHGLHVDAQLAPASAGEAHFWSRHELENGSVRFLLSRLQSPMAHADLMVTRVLAAYRSATLLREAGLREQLHSMAFEIERAGRDSYMLHTLAIDYNPRDGAVSVGRTGNGRVSLASQGASAPLWQDTGVPFSHGVRESVSTQLQLSPGEKLVCELGGDGSDQISRWVITRET